MTVKLVCVDCPPGTNRKAKRPGPRCAEHMRLRRIALSEAAWEKNTLAKYNLSKGEYWAIWEHQGGHCALCLRSTGKTKRLSVDHDHKTGFVRGLLCSMCNKILGWYRDDVSFGGRIGEYLTNPPAWAIVGKRMVRGGPG